MSDPNVIALRAIARRQRGLFTIAQALTAGFSRSTVRRRLAAGTWQEVAPRVYRSALSGPRTWLDSLAALVLSCDGIAARRSAAALYDLLPPPGRQEILVVRTRRNLERVVLHSTRDLARSDVVVANGIRATSPVRTVIDSAGDLHLERVNDFVDHAVVKRLLTPAALERRARELIAPARPGATRVIRALASSHPELEGARNEWEARMLRLSRRFRLPDPVPNYPVVVDGELRLLDLAWAPVLVCGEFDGYLPHLRTRRIFDDDRKRQNDLVDAGWKVFRITATMLNHDPRRAFAPIVRAVTNGVVAHT
jgi:hypothetical protein